MEMYVNSFKRGLQEGVQQIGLWVSLANNVSTEAIGNAGYDWLLLDMEHSPNELTTVHSQLQALNGTNVTPIVRPVWNDPVVLKRLLDIGAQTVLIPFVQNAEEAKAAVAATRYPPEGIRGVSVATRANGFGRIPDYFARANQEICVLVQVETAEALGQIEEIAAVDGVDGIFIGPSDLAADLGHLGAPRHEHVQTAIAESIQRIMAAGKAPGILAPVEEDAKKWLSLGASFVAVGSDLSLLARGAEALRSRFQKESS